MTDEHRVPKGNPTAAYPADKAGVRLAVEEAAGTSDRQADAQARRPMGPASWWRLGLVVFAALVLALWLAQQWQGGPMVTDDGQNLEPGTAGVAPQVPPPTVPTM